MNGSTNSLTSIIEKEEVQGFVEGLIGEYGWLLLIAIATILAKDMIMNFVQGLLVFVGNDFNNDDIIYISGRQARIVRVGIKSTTFYFPDASTKKTVSNATFTGLDIERKIKDWEDNEKKK